MGIETNLPSRYEMRVLEPKHIEWASAIVIHSNIFHSPMWTALYPDNKTARAYDGLKHATYLVKHQVDSGHSLGVFNKEYRFRRQESAATDGALYWDTSDEGADAEKLLEQMDFPLVSVALAYDSFNGLDMEKMAGLMGVLPLYGPVYHVLAANDKRDAKSWRANRAGEPTGDQSLLHLEVELNYGRKYGSATSGSTEERNPDFSLAGSRLRRLVGAILSL